jgi:hypothetical protein
MEIYEGRGLSCFTHLLFTEKIKSVGVHKNIVQILSLLTSKWKVVLKWNVVFAWPSGTLRKAPGGGTQAPGCRSCSPPPYGGSAPVTIVMDILHAITGASTGICPPNNGHVLPIPRF